MCWREVCCPWPVLVMCLGLVWTDLSCCNHRGISPCQSYYSQFSHNVALLSLWVYIFVKCLGNIYFGCTLTSFRTAGKSWCSSMWVCVCVKSHFERQRLTEKERKREERGNPLADAEHYKSKEWELEMESGLLSQFIWVGYFRTHTPFLVPYYITSSLALSGGPLCQVSCRHGVAILRGLREW